jgi:hypothetical protein
LALIKSQEEIRNLLCEHRAQGDSLGEKQKVEVLSFWTRNTRSSFLNLTYKISPGHAQCMLVGTIGLGMILLGPEHMA